jgi:twitching motility protein PilT
MKANGAIRHLIRENNIHQLYSAIQTGSDDGMVTLNGSLCRLVMENLVDAEIALQRSNDPKELQTLLRQRMEI